MCIFVSVERGVCVLFLGGVVYVLILGERGVCVDLERAVFVCVCCSWVAWCVC